MATKAKIDSVAYIGWRGITGCEVMDLNETLTGFIGPGGSGKSTLLMCLDYAILPDRRVMDIRPVSDLHNPQSAGIDPMVGRIDPRYGYAYVALDITTRHANRLIAGIYVEPVDGRASFNPWLIKNVPKGSSMQSLMGIDDGEHTYFPGFMELKRHLAGKGIDITTCRSVGEYGQALHEAGIIPSTMVSMADRKLYANLIETTFRGGISEEVATRLKDYLLPAQSQVQEIVRGLQECTNEVLKTRSAAADANRELAVLKSTYGVGKETVLTALRCISNDIEQSQTAVKSMQLSLENKKATQQSLATAIPSLKAEIQVGEETKNNKLAASMLELRRLSDEKEKLFNDLSDRKTKLAEASGKLSRLNNGGELWRKIAVPQSHGVDYEPGKQWLDDEIQRVNGRMFTVQSDMRKLQEEDNRLSGDRASMASEHLAEVLGGQSLEQALGYVTDKEAIALEMSLGGLVDGVVGVDVDALSTLQPSDNLPGIFWLGNEVPGARPIKDVGQWYVSATAGGCVVSSKNRLPVLGREARRARRVAIVGELESLSDLYSTLKQEADRIDGKRVTLLENHEVIRFYLQNRYDALGIDKAAKEAQRDYDQCKADHKAIDVAHSTLQDQIANIQEPYNQEIKSLRELLSKKEKDLVVLERDIQADETRIKAEQERFSGYSNELDGARGILGTVFDRFHDEARLVDMTTRHVTGLQAQRIADLGKTLGNEVVRIESFRSVNAEDRLSVVRIWPDLMTIVRETVNIDLADMDGEDLIEGMQKQRANLDSDLVRQEAALSVKARSIHLNINGAVRSQKNKLEKLSRLGQSIEFGNVTGIQITLVPRAKMLEVLEQFSEQLSLFAKEKPVDQVLKEFFETASSGKIKMDGEQLLDYRNYVDLVIEVRRNGSDWELASSLSGTETIGGGLAIALMLTRSIAVRGESGGDGVKADQIRPLFAVDEVSRLNSDGQKMLVDFAKRECFQLLVTAPTLNPSFNCTLYALIRRSDPEEKLIVRGIKYKSIEGREAA